MQEVQGDLFIHEYTTKATVFRPSLNDCHGISLFLSLTGIDKDTSIPIFSSQGRTLVFLELPRPLFLMLY